MRDKKHYTFLIPAVLTTVLVFEMLAQNEVVLKALPDRLQLVEEVEAKTPDPRPIQKADVEENTEDDTPQAVGSYEDGVYTGSSDGYGGKITVQVTVSGGQITDVSILSASGETEPYWSLAKDVIAAVKKRQTWEVDTVSGATYSSRGILGAIRNALTGETVENEAPPKVVPAGSKKQDTFVEPKSYKDGTYTGSAMGFGGNITVSVVIREGKIADIKIVNASGETDSYFSRAKNVIARILKKGSPNVDTVSGATYSSAGIINAVKRALKKAATDEAAIEPEPEVPEPAPQPTRSDQATTQQDDFEDASGYEDGIWYGTADGFGGEIKVAVTTVKGKIKSVRIVSADDETPEYLAQAKAVLSVIVSQNSPNVDAVSGATYSSTGIINAVKRALSQAAKRTETASETETSETEIQETAETEILPVNALADGIYIGAGIGYEEGTIEVQMTVADGRITDLSVISAEYDTPSYLKRAQTLLPLILKNQHAQVDTVSEATFSSNGIIEAVKDAIGQAEQAALESETSETETDTESETETGTETETETESGTETETETETESESELPAVGLEDGTYTGSALCTDDEEFCYDIQLAMTVEDGRITDLDAVRINDISEWASPEDNDYYLDRALNGWGKRAGLKKQLLEKQDAELDAVSGATYSSETIMKIISGLLDGKTIKAKHAALKTKKAGAESVQKTETVKAQETEKAPETETASDTVQVPETRKEPETEMKAEPETEMKAEPETEMKAEPETETEAEPEPETKEEAPVPESAPVEIETNSTGKEADDQ